MGKTLLLVGLLIAAVGLVLWLVSKTSLGHLPGDIVIERENFKFAFPITTSILISVILTLLLWVISRLRH
ncbi:MAG: DUF2905 domain-containing protein [Phycisphaerae bacterium]|nr:DUF2905 domain-containing protein [Phycisphaerae bacterium]